MGAKYLPTIKDQKASLSFQKRNTPNLPGFKKTAVPQNAKKIKKP